MYVPDYDDTRRGKKKKKRGSEAESHFLVKYISSSLQAPVLLNFLPFPVDLYNKQTSGQQQALNSRL